MLKILDYVFVLRPLILIPAWSFYLIGGAQGRGARWSLGDTLPAPATIACLTAVLITAYLVNQIFDRESDEMNDKCFYLSRGIFQVRTLVILAMAFFIVGSTAFQQTPAHHRVPLFLALVLSLFYSLPPLRLCARPFADMVANAVGYGGIAFVLGFGIHGRIGAGVVESMPYVLLVAATFLHTTILDVRGDRATGKISTAVLIGESAATNLAAACHAAAVIAAVLLGETYAIVITIATFPFTGYAFLARHSAASSLLVQANTLVVTAAAVVVWPAYALVVVPLIALSRFYHRRRFGIIYPGPPRTA